jgi:hypothetical protein
MKRSRFYVRIVVVVIFSAFLCHFLFKKNACVLMNEKQLKDRLRSHLWVTKEFSEPPLIDVSVVADGGFCYGHA